MKEITTSKQALTEAKKRWGKNACVKDRGPTFVTDKPKLHFRYSIGHVINIAGMFSAFSVKGQGETWDAAFKYADDAEQREKERFARLRAERS